MYTPTKAEPKAYFILLIATFVYILAVLERLAPPVITHDFMTDLNLNHKDIGTVFSSTFFAYGLVQPFAGFWADRFGPKKCLLAAAFILGISSIGFSYSVGIWTGFISRTLVGFAAGLALIPCLKLATDWLPSRLFGLAASLIISASAFSSFLAGQPLAYFSSKYGWRWSFFYLGLICLFLCLIAFIFIQNKPKTPVEIFDKENEENEGNIKLIEITLTFFKNPIFWMIGIFYAGSDAIYSAFSSLWAGPFLQDVYNLNKQEVGNILSVAAISFLVLPPILALWSSKLRSYLKVITITSFCNLIFSMFFIFVPNVSKSFLFVFCFVAPLGCQTTGLIFAFSKNLFPKKVSASVLGFLNAFALLGGALLQTLIGRRLENSPETDMALAYSYAFKPIVVYIVAGIIMAIILNKIIPKEKTYETMPEKK